MVRSRVGFSINGFDIVIASCFSDFEYGTTVYVCLVERYRYLIVSSFNPKRAPRIQIFFFVCLQNTMPYIVATFVKNAMVPDQKPQMSILGTYNSQEEAEKHAKSFSPQVVAGQYEEVRVYGLNDDNLVKTFGSAELKETYENLKELHKKQSERQKKISELQNELNKLQQDINDTQSKNPGLMHLHYTL